MKIKWEEKRTYGEEIDIQDIMEYMKDKNYHISTPMSAKVMVKTWLYRFGNYSLNEYPENIIEQIAEILLKTTKEKTTLRDIEEMINDLICDLGICSPKVMNKKDEILEMIKRYKNGE